MEPDAVFIAKVRDLRARCNGPDAATVADRQYEVLMAAPLLRALLMGDPPLMDTVNRSRRLRVRFGVARATAFQQALLARGSPVFYSRGDGLSPRTAMVANSEIATLDRDRFLKEMVMVVQGETVTVRDLIDYVANAAGAVHFGDPTRDKREVLAAVDAQLKIGGLDGVLQSLPAVGRVVADALSELLSRVEAEST